MQKQKRNKQKAVEWSYTYLVEHPIVLVHMASVHRKALEYIRTAFGVKIEAPGADLGLGTTLTVRGKSKTDVNEALLEIDDILDDVHLYQKSMTIPASAFRTIQKLRQFAVLLAFGELCRVWIVLPSEKELDDGKMLVDIHIAGKLIILKSWERLLDLFETSLSEDSECALAASLDSLITRSQFLLPKGGARLLEEFTRSLATSSAKDLDYTKNRTLDACVNGCRTKILDAKMK